jgi:hypothetical protein
MILGGVPPLVVVAWLAPLTWAEAIIVLVDLVGKRCIGGDQDKWTRRLVSRLIAILMEAVTDPVDCTTGQVCMFVSSVGIAQASCSRSECLIRTFGRRCFVSIHSPRQNMPHIVYNDCLLATCSAPAGSGADEHYQKAVQSRKTGRKSVRLGRLDRTFQCVDVLSTIVSHEQCISCWTEPSEY